MAEEGGPEPVAILTPEEVARKLQVCEDTAIKIMRTLPHADCSGELEAKAKTLRLDEDVLNAFVRGEIKRRPVGRVQACPLPQPPKPKKAKKNAVPPGLAYR